MVSTARGRYVVFIDTSVEVRRSGDGITLRLTGGGAPGARGRVASWVTTVDHKRIGILYLWT